MISVSLSPRRLWWLLAGLTAAYYFLFVAFPALFAFFGITDFGVWFLDTFALLASNDAVTRGMNPYLPNPLDYFGRAHVYSHWWLELHRFGLGRGDVFWLGLVQVVAFFTTAIGSLRPRSLKEVGWYLVALCSSSMLLILNRANNDLVVFLLLSPVVPCLFSKHRFVRLLPAFLIAVATGLKFYPAAAALVLLAGVEVAEIRARIAVTCGLVAAVGLSLLPDLVRLSSLVPKAEGLMTFGWVNLLASWHLTGGMMSAVIFALVVIVIFWRAPLFRDWKISAGDQRDWLKFVMGSSVLTGCYLTGTNYAYRWIFSLWLMPFLWRVRQNASTPPPIKKFASVTSALLVLMLWIDPLLSLILMVLKNRLSASLVRSWLDRALFVEQPMTVVFFVCLLGWLAAFIRERVPLLLRRNSRDAVLSPSSS